MFGPIPAQTFVDKLTRDNFDPLRFQKLEIGQENLFTFYFMYHKFGGTDVKIMVMWEGDSRLLSLCSEAVTRLSVVDYRDSAPFLNDNINFAPFRLPSVLPQRPSEGDPCLSLMGLWKIEVPPYEATDVEEITWFRGLVRRQMIRVVTDLDDVADVLYRKMHKERVIH